MNDNPSWHAMATERLAAMIAGPPEPRRSFVRGGASLAEVYAMAAWLRAYYRGPGAGEAAVCLVAEDRAVIAAAILAALAGGPTLLLPFSRSAASLEAIRRRTGFVSVIGDGIDALPRGVQVVRPEPDGAVVVPMVPVSPDRVILHLSTGGTTGAPRIWKKTAANVLLESWWLADFFRVTEGDCIVATVSPYHIYGLLYTVLLPLVSPAAVAPETPSYPGDIVEAIQRHRATILVSVPAHYAALQGKPVNAGSLRLAISSAGMLAEPSNHDFTERNQVDLFEIYGSTETGGIARRNRFRGETMFTFFPMIERRCSQNRLAVRSPFLSPDLPADAEGFFATGDAVQFSGEDMFLLQGRIDHIAKVGGKRVDLEAVRMILKRQPGVVDAVVLAVPAAGGRENRIVALVQGTCGAEQLRAAVAQEAEPYALPRTIKVVAAIPLTATGKVDREAIGALLSHD